MIVPNKHEINNYLKSKGKSLDSQAGIAESPEINALIASELRYYSKELANFEQIKAFHLLDNEMTLETGELTPTMKYKRNFIREKYKSIIAPLFLKNKQATNQE